MDQAGYRPERQEECFLRRRQMQNRHSAKTSAARKKFKVQDLAAQAANTQGLLMKNAELRRHIDELQRSVDACSQHNHNLQIELHAANMRAFSAETRLELVDLCRPSL
jgi:hypothetical protein